MKKILLGFMALACSALVVTSCNETPKVDEPQPIQPTSVKLNHPSQALEPNQTLQLEATVLPADAENLSVSWSSDKTDVASVSNTGLVTALAEGSATITAKTVNNLTATCSITVSKNVVAVTAVRVAAADPDASTELLEGGTFQLKATVEPATATDKEVLWSSSDEKIAKVDENGLVTAAASVAQTSPVTITARANANETITGTFALTVKHTVVILPDVTAIALFDGETEITQDGTIWLDVSKRTSVDLTAQVMPLEASKRLTWITNGEDTLTSTTVPDEDTTEPNRYMGTTDDGKITFTAIKNEKGDYVAGLHSLSVRTPANDVRLDFKITVLVPPTALHIDATDIPAKFNPGSTFTPRLNVTPATATTSVDQFEWSSSNPDVATIGATYVGEIMRENGVITAKAVGTTTITVRSILDNTIADQFDVTVVDATTPVSEIRRVAAPVDVYKMGDYDVTYVTYGKAASSFTYNLSSPAVITPASRMPNGTDIRSNLSRFASAPFKPTYEVLPADATNKSVAYQSSDANVISISAAGVMTIVGPGEATITLSSVSNPEVTLDYKFKVLPKATGVTFAAPTTIETTVGAEVDLSGYTLGVQPAEALQTVFMTSLTPDVATFDTNGDNIITGEEVAARKLKALAVGETTIRVEPIAATVDGTSATATPQATITIVVK